MSSKFQVGDKVAIKTSDPRGGTNTGWIVGETPTQWKIQIGAAKIPKRFRKDNLRRVGEGSYHFSLLVSPDDPAIQAKIVANRTCRTLDNASQALGAISSDKLIRGDQKAIRKGIEALQDALDALTPHLAAEETPETPGGGAS